MYAVPIRSRTEFSEVISTVSLAELRDHVHIELQSNDLHVGFIQLIGCELRRRGGWKLQHDVLSRLREKVGNDRARIVEFHWEDAAEQHAPPQAASQTPSSRPSAVKPRMLFKICPQCSKHVRVVDLRCWNCGCREFPNLPKVDDEVLEQLARTYLNDAEFTLWSKRATAEVGASSELKRVMPPSTTAVRPDKQGPGARIVARLHELLGHVFTRRTK